MKIETRIFTYPFEDEKWLTKFAIGGGLGFFFFLIIPALILYGYGLHIMRQIIQTGEYSLPEWESWREMLRDGFNQWIVVIVYGLPTLVFTCCAVAGWLSAFPALVFAEQAPLAGIAGLGFLMVAGGAFSLMLPLSFISAFLAFVAVTRYVALGRLEAAFELNEVWALARKGFKYFLVALLVWYIAIFTLSFAMNLLVYTVVLACLLPFFYGALIMYSTILQGVMYGMAYRAIMAEDEARTQGPVPAV